MPFRIGKLMKALWDPNYNVDFDVDDILEKKPKGALALTLTYKWVEQKKLPSAKVSGVYIALHPDTGKVVYYLDFKTKFQHTSVSLIMDTMQFLCYTAPELAAIA